MGTIELFILAVGLSMDAFAVAICKGLAVPKIKPSEALLTGLYFGFFQAFMPVIGYYLGINFSSLIESVDHWVAFVLLGLIGANMIREARTPDSCETSEGFGPRAMLPLAVATSIDALAVGVTFAFIKANIWLSVGLIGVVTFLLSTLGVVLGKIVGSRFKSKAELLGGAVLILIGLKILLEGLHVF